jgi:hypothetical protein
MKYIRTKDGIFRRYKNSTIIDNIFYYPDNGGFPEYRREPILKQADTIEELCDEIVYVEDSKGVKFYPPLLNIQFVIEHHNQISTNKLDINNFYGAIWTDKGLIYVAKMNEKGELELL